LATSCADFGVPCAPLGSAGGGELVIGMAAATIRLGLESLVDAWETPL
jgi:hypothetical protein